MVIDDAFIFKGAIGLIAGLAMVVFPRFLRLRAEQRRSQRIAELKGGGEERSFEELRALETYTLPRTDLKWRLVGLFLIAAGIFMIISGFHGGLLLATR